MQFFGKLSFEKTISHSWKFMQFQCKIQQSKPLKRCRKSQLLLQKKFVITFIHCSLSSKQRGGKSTIISAAPTARVISSSVVSNIGSSWNLDFHKQSQLIDLQLLILQCVHFSVKPILPPLPNDNPRSWRIWSKRWCRQHKHRIESCNFYVEGMH